MKMLSQTSGLVCAFAFVGVSATVAQSQTIGLEGKARPLTTQPMVEISHYDEIMRCLSVDAQLRKRRPIAISVGEARNPQGAPYGETDESQILQSILGAIKSPMVTVLASDRVKADRPNFILKTRFNAVDRGQRDRSRDISSEIKGVAIDKSKNRSSEVAQISVTIETHDGEIRDGFFVIAYRQPKAKSLSIAIRFGNIGYIGFQNTDTQADGPGAITAAMYRTAAIASIQRIFGLKDSKCLTSGVLDPIVLEFEQKSGTERIDVIASALVKTGFWPWPNLTAEFVEPLKRYQQQAGLRQSAQIDKESYVSIRSAGLRAQPSAISAHAIALSQALQRALNAGGSGRGEALILNVKARVFITQQNISVVRPNLQAKKCVTFTGAIENGATVRRFTAPTLACELFDGVFATGTTVTARQKPLHNPVYETSKFPLKSRSHK
jgi:hypothetical protein